jgi:hypothetical protein
VLQWLLELEQEDLLTVDSKVSSGVDLTPGPYSTVADQLSYIEIHAIKGNGLNGHLCVQRAKGMMVVSCCAEEIAGRSTAALSVMLKCCSTTCCGFLD